MKDLKSWVILKPKLYARHAEKKDDKGYGIEKYNKKQSSETVNFFLCDIYTCGQQPRGILLEYSHQY